MPAVEQRGHVDVQDIPFLERLFGRDAVAHDVVDRDAARVRIAAIAQRRGDRAAIERQFADLVVDRRRGDARLHHRRNLVEDLGGKASGLAHAFESLGAMQLDRAIAQDGFVAGFDNLVFAHPADIAVLRGNCEIIAPPKSWCGTAA